MDININLDINKLKIYFAHEAVNIDLKIKVLKALLKLTKVVVFKNNKNNDNYSIIGINTNTTNAKNGCKNIKYVIFNNKTNNQQDEYSRDAKEFFEKFILEYLQ